MGVVVFFGLSDGFRVALPILRWVLCVLFGFVGWVERSETHQFKLAVIEDQQARYRHADTRWVNRGYQLSIQFGFNTLIIKAFIC
jgi:hypothetical protein